WDLHNHDLPRIRTALGCTAVTTWVCNYTSSTYVNKWHETVSQFQPGLIRKPAPTNDLATFAWHKASSIDIGVKRSSKVTVHVDGAALDVFHAQNGVSDYDAMPERVQKDSTHF